MAEKKEQDKSTKLEDETPRYIFTSKRILPPIPNYSLSTICPACNSPTERRACKVRCDTCGFMWDCSEL